VNLKYARDWLDALGGCFPDLKPAALRQALTEADAALPGGRWQLGVRGGGFSALAVRHLAPAGATRIPAAAAAAFGLKARELPAAPAAGRPWLEAFYDARRGRLTSARAGAQKPRRFSAARFGDAALEKALAEFAALTGVSAMVFEPSSGRWSLPLGPGVAFSDFLRCDLSAAFTEQCGQYALLMRNSAVAEVAFDGEALWAFCAG
jgi:hypothetical protein